MAYDQEIDTTGLICPLPVLKARKRLKTMKTGEKLSVLADDPASQIDFPHFCAEQGMKLLVAEERGNGIFHFVIEVV